MTVVVVNHLTSAHLASPSRNETGHGDPNLGEADGLPIVDWDAIVEKLDARSAPAPDAHNARTTWLTSGFDPVRPSSSTLV